MLKTVDWILAALADPNVAFAMVALGMFAIYMELSAPRWIVPGALGAAGVLIGLSRLALFPINPVAAAILIGGIVLLAMEAKFEAHWLLGCGGAFAIVVGASRLIDRRIHLSVAIAFGVPFAWITILLLRRAMRARENKSAA